MPSQWMQPSERRGIQAISPAKSAHPLWNKGWVPTGVLASDIAPKPVSDPAIDAEPLPRRGAELCHHTTCGLPATPLLGGQRPLLCASFSQLWRRRAGGVSMCVSRTEMTPGRPRVACRLPWLAFTQRTVQPRLELRDNPMGDVDLRIFAGLALSVHNCRCISSDGRPGRDLIALQPASLLVIPRTWACATSSTPLIRGW